MDVEPEICRNDERPWTHNAKPSHPIVSDDLLSSETQNQNRTRTKRKATSRSWVRFQRPSVPAGHRTGPVPVVDTAISNSSNTLELRNPMQKVAEEGTRRIYAEQAGPSMRKKTEKALFEIFFDAFEEANAGFRNTSYYFIEGVLTVTASKDSLDDVFERDFERWTQWSTFMPLQGHLHQTYFKLSTFRATSCKVYLQKCEDPS